MSNLSLDVIWVGSVMTLLGSETLAWDVDAVWEAAPIAVNTRIAIQILEAVRTFCTPPLPPGYPNKQKGYTIHPMGDPNGLVSKYSVPTLYKQHGARMGFILAPETTVP